MYSIINVFSKLGFWGFVLTFTILAIIVSELLIIVQSYWLTGTFTDKNLLIVGFITPVIGALILFSLVGLLLNQMRNQQDALRHSHEKVNSQKQLFQQYLDITDMMLVALDRNGKISMANKMTCDIMGFDNQEDIIGKDWFELYVPAENYEQVYTTFREIIDGNLEPYRSYENNIKLPDGSMKFISWKNEYIYGSNREIIGTLSSGKDITEEREAQNELEEQRNLLRTVIDEIPYPVISKNWEGKFLLGNKACAELYNTTPEQMVGKDDGDFIDDQQVAEFFRQNIQSIMRKGNTEVVYEDSQDAETGEYRHYRSIKKPFKNAKGEDEILVIAQDITEEKRNLKQLFIMQEAVENFDDAYYLLDQNSNFVTTNKAASKELNYSEQELSRMGVFDIDHSYPRQAWPQFWQAIKEKGSDRFETAHQRKDGSKFPVEVVSSFLIYDDEEYVLSIARNISEHKQDLKHLFLLENALDNSNDAFYLVDTDARFLMANQAILTQLGYLSDEFTQMGIEDIDERFSVENWPREMQGIKQAGGVRFQTLHTRKDGSKIPVDVAAKVVEYDNQQYVVAQIRDITEQQRQQKLLQDERDRFSLAVEGSQDGIWDWNLKTGDIFFSTRYKEILGFSEQTFNYDSETWVKLVYPEDISDLNDDIQNHLNGKSEFFENKHRMFCADGSLIWVKVRGKALFDETGKPTRMVGFLSDISEETKQQEKLDHIAKHDVLTDLPNRFMLNELLQSLMSRSERNGSLLAVLYLDLDGFKEINDLHGHETGDKVLIKIASRIREIMRLEDLVARIGGDEFVIVYPDVTEEEKTIPMIQRLLDEISYPIQVKDIDNQELSFNVSASIGVSFYPQQQKIGSDAMLRQADQAMYKAKTEGKNQYKFFNLIETEAAKREQGLINEFSNALRAKQMCLYYQPKVNINNGEVIGFEVLLRWQHPERGILAPDSFLPVINSNASLMKELGRTVFKKSFEQLSEWQSQGHNFHLSINISAHELHSVNTVDYLQELLAIHKNISPKQVELEILESSALQDTQVAMERIGQFHKLGVEVALDDFGTGFSTLANLKNLPVNTLKIDRTFVSDMHKDASKSIIEASIGLANAFGCSVVAEGVETKNQCTKLMELGCDFAQGYYISKPMPGDQVNQWLKHWNQSKHW